MSNDLYENSTVLELKTTDFSSDKSKVSHPDFKNGGFVMFYADWCPHCKNPDTVNMWKQFGGVLKGVLPVGAVNGADDKNVEPKILEKIGVSGFPTIKVINAGGKASPYGGDRNIEDLLKVTCSAFGKCNLDTKKISIKPMTGGTKRVKKKK